MARDLRDPALATAYSGLLRPALFRTGGGDAETAHHRTLQLVTALGRHPRALRAVRGLLAAPATPVQAFGVAFPNRVGLAAGMDKDGVGLAAWGGLGFGHVELGTVTARAQPGNDRPRLFRLPRSRAVINRMGFNNAGVHALAARLREARTGAGGVGLPVGVSIGKTKSTPVEQAVEDYLTSVEALHGLADYLAVNVSSPNTPGLRGLQDAEPLRALLTAVVGRTRELAGEGRAVPVLVKLAPDLDDRALEEALGVALAAGVRGVIATNTTTSREGVDASEEHLAREAGGLSGAPLTVRARQVVRFVSERTDLPVIGVGGIMGVADARAMLDAGATLVQVYTGLVYAGPALVRGIARL